MSPKPPHAADAPGFLGVLREVLWAFLGVRDHANYARTTRAKPWQIILAGLLATAGFIGLLLLAVRLALRSTGTGG